MDSATSIRRAVIWHLQIPLRVGFSHALATRKKTDNFIVEIVLDNDICGFGEAIPRTYLTGETLDDVRSRMLEWTETKLAKARFASFDDAVHLIDELGVSLPTKHGLAALAGVELALLDCVGKTFGRAAGEAIGDTEHAFHWTGSIDTAIDFCPPEELDAAIDRVAACLERYDWGEIKVKAGRANDYERLSRIRERLGDDVDIRIDANGAWSGDEAVETMLKLRNIGIVTVEQPCAADDLYGMRMTRELAGARVVADESLCSADNLEQLIEHEAVDVANIRLLKCGGLRASKRLYDIASAAGLDFQYNGLIGETGIAQAATRHFLGRIGRQFLYAAGGSQRERFDQGLDLVEEDLRLGDSCSTSLPRNDGLGVTVNRDRLKEWASPVAEWKSQ